MFIRCWGARGSIPVCGAQYLRYGGDTACMEVRGDGGRVLVLDAGSGIRRLGNLLRDEQVDEIDLLFTHAHWDHLLGFPFFKPLYRRGCRIRVHGSPSAQKTLHKMISETMAPPNFPLPLEEVHADVSFHETDDARTPLELAGLHIRPITLSHPDEGMGYRVESGGRSFVFLTDNELACRHGGGRSFEDYAAFCHGADLLIHDAEFTPDEYHATRTWGHSTYEDALRLALAARVTALGLYHHNQDRADDEVDAIVATCRDRIAAGGGGMDCFGVTCQTELTL